MRQHREEIMRADEFGEKLSSRLSATSTFGMKEMWRMFKVINQPKKNKLKNIGKEKKDKGNAVAGDETIDPNTQQDTTILDDIDDSEDARDLKCLGLNIMSEVTDLHERIRKFVLFCSIIYVT